MVRNLLDALRPDGGVRHVAPGHRPQALPRPVRGLRQGQRCRRRRSARSRAALDVENFYYAQEDEVFAAAARDGFGWSVHRPHTIIGYAVGNAMNMGVTLAVYATLCRETGRPFLLPRLGRAVERADRHDRCAPARAPPGLGRDHAGGPQPGLQRRQRRRLPLELDVGPHRRLVRRGAGALPRRRCTPLEQQLADAAPLWAEIAAPRMAWPSPTSAASPRPGTRMPISAGRSRSSPT